MGKKDALTKEFWRDNAHFADLFNTVFFQGEPVIRAEDLQEMDTDETASVELGKEQKYRDILTKSRDVVKKTAFGVEFVMLAIENQAEVDYSMPVRNMMYDALGYWKECRMLSQRNIAEKRRMTGGEFFSIAKEDKIHPIVTITVYYGEKAWDGAKSLYEMMTELQDAVKNIVSDYPLKLVELRSSDHLVFHNPDVSQLFALVRGIYRKEIHTDAFRSVRRDLAALVGTIVHSERIMKLAQTGQKEERLDMCRALEEMMLESEIKGEARGETRGQIKGEEKFARLIRILSEKNDFEAIRLVSQDEQARENYYKKYTIS